jgi:hypothetical protein
MIVYRTVKIVLRAFYVETMTLIHAQLFYVGVCVQVFK